ncbi:MAG TPA: VOC family protein [Acidobacteriota bacterium]|nr:VOC family protein [Acidobacteriota bacterium]
MTAGFEVVGETFVAVQVPDAQASAEWYQRVLGLEEVKRLDAEDGRFSIRILARTGLTVELIRTNTAVDVSGTPRGLFKAGFYVDDIGAAFRWLNSQQVETDEGIFSDEALSVRTFVFRDPDGNRLQVFAKLSEN